MERPHEPDDSGAADRCPPLALPAELTVYTVGELHPQWLSWLASCTDPALPESETQGAVLVQAAAVDQIDGAGLQLLLALQRQVADLGRTLWIAMPSAVLHQACEALGLADWLASHGAAAPPAAACAGAAA